MHRGWSLKAESPRQKHLPTAVGAFVFVSAMRRAVVGGGGMVERAPWDLLGVALIALMAIGGVLIVVGAQWRGTYALAHGLERAGLYLAGSTWLAHTITLWPYVDEGVAGRGYPDLFDVAQGMILATGCFARAWALRRCDEYEEAVAEILLREEDG